MRDDSGAAGATAQPEVHLAGCYWEELLEARALVQASLAHHKEQPRLDPAALTYADEEVLGSWLPDGSD